MRTIVIFKTSKPEERITLQTDLMNTDYQEKFTIMTIDGSIEGVSHGFHVGSVIDMQEIESLLANNESVDIEAVVCAPETSQESVEKAKPRFLSLDAFLVNDEVSYKQYVSEEYRKSYSYEDSKPFLPWIVIKSKKAVNSTEYTLEIKKDGVPCSFVGTSSNVGEVEGTTITMTKANVMFDVKNDLGQTDVRGTYELKFTMGGIVSYREIVIP